ncbi:WcaI family glycosyltransferase [Rhizosphaericola mali]|uniref:WcaI family glycosyltransferase n=1 Tax=Rhizosphaericola mali TaxID=2545455 RepID=A0A5P2FWV0_9BACT|nr:WcaI family glycosyltransferase [Rhizosphaericola mali]QES87996.1 WcaI family glycosyltransferase [Rhizosphaericola mali]
MRILIYGINFTPELTGIGKYTGEMVDWLNERGHFIKIITAKPYYPQWKVNEEYKKGYWKSEKKMNIMVNRVPMYVPSKPDSVKRILHELSFQTNSLPYWLGTFFQKKYDVVICITPAFHLGFLPLIYCKLRRSKFWTHIQDLQVDAAKELKMINNEVVLNVMFGLENFLLRNSDIISSISKGMIDKIKKKNIQDTPVLNFPNWVDNKVIYPISKENSLRSKLGFSQEDIILLYSGNLGEKQGLEIMVHVASRFSLDEKINFVICGSGGNKHQLEALAKEAELKNLFFFPLQPYEDLSKLLAIADVHLILQKKSASDLVMPSKLTGILACGGLAIVSAVENTSLYDVIFENNLGILIEPESVDALENGIRQALEQSNEKLKQNALDYARKYLDKDAILTQFESDLQIVSGKK